MQKKTPKSMFSSSHLTTCRIVSKAIKTWMLFSVEGVLCQPSTFDYASPTDPIPNNPAPKPLFGPLSFYGNESVFPEILLEHGNPFGSRPVLGDVSRLERAVQEAKDFQRTGKVLVIVVLGGSPGQGAACPHSLEWMASADNPTSKLQSQAGPTPGIVENGNFAFWSKREGETGDIMRCSWSGRLARYIGMELLPEHRNFVVINGCEGGVGSMYNIVNAHHNFEERSTNFPASSPWATMSRPLAQTADLILMDLTANDIQKTESEYLSGTEALFRYFAGLHHREKGLEPTVALVDQACTGSQYDKEGKGVPYFHAVRRALASSYHVPVVDSVLDGSLHPSGPKTVMGGAAVSEEERADRHRFLESLPLAAPLMDLLTSPARGASGFGHNNAAYHEWVAASVFYSLLAPSGSSSPTPELPVPSNPPLPALPMSYNCSSLSDGGRGATLCHLEKSTVTLYNFMESPAAASLRHDPNSWVWGQDVAGKNGWVTCDSDPGPSLGSELGNPRDVNELSLSVRCERGDLIVGFLRSYDPRMGVVEITATLGSERKSVVVDAWRPEVHESVFATAVLQGLETPGSPDAFSTWSVSFQPRSRPNATADGGGSGGDGGARTLTSRPTQQNATSTPPRRRRVNIQGDPLRRRAARLLEAKIDPAACHKEKFKLMVVACT